MTDRLSIGIVTGLMMLVFIMLAIFDHQQTLTGAAIGISPVGEPTKKISE